MIDLYDSISEQYEADTGGTAITLSGLAEFIKPRFIFKGSNDCCMFYLDDKTDYTEVADVSGGQVEINVSLYYESCCNPICICSSRTMDQNGRLEIPNPKGDGTYSVYVTMTYTYEVDVEGEIEIVVVTDTFKYSLTIECCKDLKEDIICDSESKMTSILCEINKRRKVGRDYCKLMWSLYELSNVRWLMLMSCIDCEDTQFFKCYIDKIKGYNCGMC